MQAALTELEAVNSIMLACGLAPINQFQDGVFDQAIAREELRNAVRQVCSHGFRFNTDDNYVLTPDVDGFIAIPTGAMRVDPSDPRQDLVQKKHPSRGWCLWDRANHTFQMSEPVSVTVSWSFEYDALPEIARAYAIARAGQGFQAKSLGDAQADRFTDREVSYTWSVLINDDAATADRNIFRCSPELAAKTNRSRRGWRAV